MALEELHVHSFRNISAEKLVFSPELNLIFGANGSGKTSLLEAVYYLASGHSFRTSNHRRVVQTGSETLTVFGQVIDEKGVRYRLGIKRYARGKELVLHRNGIRVRSIAELARVIPVSVIEPGTFQLVAGSPGHRRRFMDWLVFHVEHRYGEVWKQCQRAIRQRNQCLRRGTINEQELRPWSEQVAGLGEEVTRLRRIAFERFHEELKASLKRTEACWGRELQMEFVQGWDRTQSLAMALTQNPQSEQRAGFTLYGPNRADIRIRCEGMPAGDVLSRGQQRSLVVLMKLAQMRVLRNYSDIAAICLVDDMNAELDVDNQGFLVDELMGLGCQLFVTSIKSPDDGAAWTRLSASNYRMFHVEHGQFAEQ